ncbi:hypothetical protein KCU64_g6096, partial [Aureobasidium melanogenum]
MSTAAVSLNSVALSTQTVSEKKNTARVHPLTSLFAGAVAGGVEAGVTYPFEYAKTSSQLRSQGKQGNAFQALRSVVASQGLSGIYTGCSALIVGTALKAGVRFLAFDTIKAQLADENGKLSTSGGILAGSVAGAVESVLAVTPTERIKTALIDDGKGAKRFRSTPHAVGILIREQGIAGLYRGLVSTTIKQSATSAVRMGSYNTLKTHTSQTEVTTIDIHGRKRLVTMPPERRHARAQQACAYCRQRKMKCTGERPRCKNCEIYEQECVFDGPTRKPRPTSAALNELLEENRRLREQVSTRSPPDDQLPDRVHVEASSDAIHDTMPEQTLSSEEHVNAAPIDQPHHESNDLVETPASVGSTTYHGPTSTLFNEAASSSRQSRSYLTKERETWMPKILVAAAAEQRQLESINYRAGKLDFDGVDPELGMHLLNLHWNRQHHSFLITYRPAFMRDMACKGPYFSKILLNAIFYGASKFSPRLDLRKDPNDVRTAGWQFRNRVRDLLGQALDHSEITTIQALLQMSNSLFALGDEQSAAWVYAGTAFRMLVDVGLHVDAAKMPTMQRLSEEDLEIRRRVYWSAYVVDKMQSLYQGRPASLRAIDGQVPIKFMDTYEELEQWHPFAYASGPSYPGSPSYSVSTFQQLCKLCMILQQILDKTYCEREQKRSTQGLVQDLQDIEKQLQHWMTELPEHLRIDINNDGGNQQLPPPHVFSLQFLDQNSATNHAVKKASIVIESLKKRMGIRDPLIDHPSSEMTPRPQSNTFASPNASGMARSHLPIDTMINHEPTMVAGQFDPDLDVDTIIHSFMHEQQLYGPSTNLSMPSEDAINTLYGGNAMPHTTQGEASNISLESYDDALFGFNASAFDWVYPSTASGSYPQH